MNNSMTRNSSGSVFAGGVVASVLSAVAVFLATSSAPIAHRSAYLFARHVTFTSVVFAAVFAVLWQSCGIFLGLYGSAHESRTSAVTKAFECSVAMTVLLGLCLALTAPRPPVVRIMSAFLCCALICELTRLALSKLFRPDATRVVIVGRDRLAAKAWREFRVHPDRHMEVAGFVDYAAQPEMMPDIASRYLGDVDDLPRILLNHDIDDVIVATPAGSHTHALERAISEAGSLGARILCLKDVCGIHPETIGRRDDGDILFELVPAPRLNGFEHASKRLFDVVVSASVLVLGSSLLLPIGVLSLVQSRPVAYRPQIQLGFRRRKYRRLCLASAPTGPRVTLLLEVLPSMWNVLLGHMSLVGPDPIAASETAQAEMASLAGRFNVRPGVIGHPIFDPAIAAPPARQFDEIYNWSLRTDLKTLARAFRMGLERSAVVDAQAGTL